MTFLSKTIKVALILGLPFFIVVAFLSMRIPFIYEDRFYLSITLAYVFLSIWFSGYVLFEKGIDKTRVKTNYKFVTFFYLVLMPLLMGLLCSFFVPIVADFYASNYTIRELKVLEIKPLTSRLMKPFNRIYVADIHNKKYDLLIKKGFCDDISLHEGEKILVVGRESFAGVVIDEINSVKRKESMRSIPK